MTVRLIHVPKTGGTAMVEYFRTNQTDFLWAHQKPSGHWAGKHRTVSSYIDEDTTKIAVKRNPHTRTVSFYRFLQRWYTLECSFDKFVIEKRVPTDNRTVASPWRCQVEWMLHDNQMAIDKIFCFENLQAELQEYFNITAPMNRVNVTNIEEADLMSWYHPETYDIIRQHFDQDFKILGYA
jgi:hypothetical protein